MSRLRSFVQKFFPQLLLILFGLAVSLGQLEKISVYASLAIYVHEFSMVIWLGYWFWQQPNFRSAVRKLPTRLNKIGWLLIGWVGLGWLLAVVSHAALTNSLFYVIRLGFYGLFAWSLWWVGQQKFVTFRFMKMSLLMAGFYVLYFGFLQYFFLPDTRFLQFLGWDDHYFRFIATLLDPGFTGIVLVLNLLLWYQFSTTKHGVLAELKLRLSPPQKLAILLSVSFMMTLAISLTYSRATYVAFLVSGLLAIGYSWWQKKRDLLLTIFASLVLLVVSLPFLPRPTGEGVRLERTSTIVSRTTSIQSSVTDLQSWQWVVGQGLFVTSGNQLLTNQTGGHNRVPDNWLVMLVTETGFVGTALVIWLVGTYAWKNWRKNPWFWIAFVAVLLHGLFNASLIYVFVLIWLSGLSLPNETRA